jgi:DNA-binding beta-propeller fold protein YncE
VEPILDSPPTDFSSLFHSQASQGSYQTHDGSRRELVCRPHRPLTLQFGSIFINWLVENIIIMNGDCRVLIFKPSFEFIRSFGSRGRQRGQFEDPSGIAIDREGNLIIADTGNHRIQRFLPSGEFLSEFRTGGGPFGVVVDCEGIKPLFPSMVGPFIPHISFLCFFGGVA